MRAWDPKPTTSGFRTAQDSDGKRILAIIADLKKNRLPPQPDKGADCSRPYLGAPGSCLGTKKTGVHLDAGFPEQIGSRSPPVAWKRPQPARVRGKGYFWNLYELSPVPVPYV